MKVMNFFNFRTIIVLLFAELAAFITIYYQIKFDLNLLLFSLAIGFPLAFSIQSAFKRREKALEYFSLFKAGAISIHNSFEISEDLPQENKLEGRNIVIAMASQLITQLENRAGDYAAFQPKANAVLTFIAANREMISNRNILRIVRYLKDVTESSAYLLSLVRHRTMAGLRFYALLFIMVFPFIQAPMLLYRLGPIAPDWIIYIFIALSSLLLVTLYNFQQLIEFPFDEKGMDNIKVRDFELNL